jgi:hypothetical protein
MSGKQPLCDPYFWENPRVLAGSAWLRRWTENFDARCASDITNEVAAVYLFFFLIGSVLAIALSQPYILPISLIVATLYLAPAISTLYFLPDCKVTGVKSGLPVLQDYQHADSSEKAVDKSKTYSSYLGNKRVYADRNSRGTKVDFQEGFDPKGRLEPTPVETMPTARNPFMNVLVDEIKYNATRPPAKYIGSPDVQDSLDSFFRVQWSSDPTDIFGKTQSQRQFITMPSTSIPSDRGSYQDWLYKIPGKTCKEGGRDACYPGTDGSPVTWLNVHQ